MGGTPMDLGRRTLPLFSKTSLPVTCWWRRRPDRRRHGARCYSSSHGVNNAWRLKTDLQRTDFEDKGTTKGDDTRFPGVFKLPTSLHREVRIGCTRLMCCDSIKAIA